MSCMMSVCLIRNEKNGVLTILAGKRLIIVSEGKTFLNVDRDAEADLLSVAPELSEDSVLVAEIGAILKYIDGVSVEIDDTNKMYKITVEKQR